MSKQRHTPEFKDAAADVPYEPHSEVPELGYSVLSGDPSEAGVYVVRLDIPPGLSFPPHPHQTET